MYERMLDKQVKPSFDDLFAYCGAQGALWAALDKYMEEKYAAQKLIRFPYGKKYGWSIKYSRKSKHICDIFAEKDAFTVFLRLSDDAFASIESALSAYAKDIYANKYPCDDGGWIYYRVTCEEHVGDAKAFIEAKVKS